MIANLRWSDALRGALDRGETAVLVTVAAASGSTPREAGTAMLVMRGALAGSIGGGHLEFEAMRIARAALAAGTQGAWALRFPLAARLGQCCGGVATLAFATLDATAGDWLERVAACQRAGLPCVLATRLAAGGRGRLVVTGDAAHGTLGDGPLDAAAVSAARARLAVDDGTALAELQGEAILLHLVRPAAFPVVVFGNGHVGRALVQVLGALPAEVTWVDTREHDFPAALPGNVAAVPVDDPLAEVIAAPRGAYLVVVTHSHAQDFALVAAALARDDFAYVGMIGSHSKRAQFERRLLQRGASPEALARLTCPIGAALSSKEPGVIAVGVVAEMLKRRELASARAPSLAARAPNDARMAASTTPVLPSA